MSVLKGRLEYRVILDFSRGKISKNLVKRSLRQTQFLDAIHNGDDITLIENCIKVGMYQIDVLPYTLSIQARCQLKDYGGFAVHIREPKQGKMEVIAIYRDPRFKRRYWVEKDRNYRLRTNDLVNIITYCRRLNDLKAFL